MGLIDDLSKALSPHVHKVTDTLNLQGAVLHQRLQVIEGHVSDLARPDVADQWRDLYFNGAIGGFAPKEIDAVPMNEIWMVQAMNVLMASAVERVIVRANKRVRLVAPVTTTLPATLNIGGNIVFLPGEIITFEGEKEAVGEVSVTIIRRRLPVQPIPRQMGRGDDVLAPSNTHDPARDMIRAKLGQQYQEIPGETRDTTGRPPLIDPQSR